MPIFTEKEGQYIRNLKYCVVATQEKTGDLHLVPITYSYNGSEIFIRTHERRKKVFNLRNNGKIAVLITKFHGESGKAEGLMIKGTAQILDSGEEYLKIGETMNMRKQGFDEKANVYMWGPYRQVIIKVKPTSKSSWGINRPYQGSDTYQQSGTTDLD